jgi:MFS transporter, DHA1 family, inner membrane transport protein
MHGRRLAILTAGNFFVATSFMSVTGLLNEIAASLQISIPQASVLMSVFAITAGICAPILATFGSRIDRRNLLAGSLAICAVANVFAALGDSYPQLLAARILAAVTSAVYTPQVAATVSMMVRPEERGPVLGKLMAGWAVGAVVGQPLVVLIGSYFDWRTAMACIAVGGGVVAVLVWRAVPRNVHVPPLNLQRWIEVARSPSLRLLTFTTGLNAVGNHLVFSLIAPTLLALHGATGKVLAALFFVNGLGGLAGSFFAIHMMSRVGATRVAYWSSAMIIGVYVLWPIGAVWLAVIFFLQFFWSAGNAGFPAAQQTRLVTVAPTLAAATIAMNSSIGYLGNSVGTVLGGIAWRWVQPQYLSWFGLVFLCASFGCSILGERAAKQSFKQSLNS